MVYEEHKKSHEKSEIVIKITPRNLERLIYIIVIIGLLAFSILAIRYTKCETAEVVEENNSTENTSGAVSADVEEEEEEVVEEEPEQTTPTLSGKIEFELISASACIINETLDQGRLKTVKVKIYNGLTGPIQTMVDLYLWDEDEKLDIIEDKITSIKKIYTIPSGITYTLPALIKTGIFKDISDEKKVKAVIKYADGSEISSSRLKVIDDTVQNVKARDDC